jgi:NAD(P)-dependent dehydrogenase (short-subunit alcohol dehydrogenase family)
LGREVALGLSAAGAAVGIIARSAVELNETVRLIEESGGVGVAAQADVSDRSEARAAIEAVSRVVGPIDVLVNNAGVTGPFGAFADVDPDAWWRTVEINLGGAVNCSRLVLADMVARRRGRIINVTSEAGVFRWPTVSAYAVSKAALVKFTENLAAETRRHDVQVFSFHPGLLPIGFASTALANPAPPGSAEAKVLEWALRERALGRGAEPDEAVAFIVSLAAGHADALSGRHLSVHDDLEGLLERVDEVVRLDLHTLRLRHTRGDDEPIRETTTRMSRLEQGRTGDEPVTAAEGTRRGAIGLPQDGAQRAASEVVCMGTITTRPSG